MVDLQVTITINIVLLSYDLGPISTNDPESHFPGPCVQILHEHGSLDLAFAPPCCWADEVCLFLPWAITLAITAQRSAS